MTDDEREAARLLASGYPPIDVSVLFPSADLAKREVLELADWLRQSSSGADRLTADYVEVRTMALVDDDSAKCEHCGRGGKLDEKTKAKLLMALARLKSRSR